MVRGLLHLTVVRSFFQGEGESQDCSQGEEDETQDGGASNDLGDNNNNRRAPKKRHREEEQEQEQEKGEKQQGQAEKGKHPSPPPRMGKGVDRQENTRVDSGGGSSSAAGVAKVGGAAASEPTGVRPLVLCLNAKGEEELFLDALMADGVPPNRLPEVGCGWSRVVPVCYFSIVVPVG